MRDIVSGVFFMSDDAFRVGEYIDTGRLKGTVERVTLRSVRLRHQNGQIHTIPFGQLNSISNFSRDWQTVKFNLRLVRDADLEKARKSIKRVGQEMLQDAELGKEYLLPLTLWGGVMVSARLSARQRAVSQLPCPLPDTGTPDPAVCFLQ